MPRQTQLFKMETTPHIVKSPIKLLTIGTPLRPTTFLLCVAPFSIMGRSCNFAWFDRDTLVSIGEVVELYILGCYSFNRNLYWK